jgi:hypothetical protein
MGKRTLTDNEKEQRKLLKIICEISGIPYQTLLDWRYKKDEDYRKFLYFMLNTLSIDEVKRLREEFNKYINTAEEERLF